MHPKIAGLLLSATCAGVLALTLTAAADANPATSGASAAAEATSATHYALYRNDQWHFALEAPSNTSIETMDIPGGVSIDFSTPDGDELFMVSAWRYQDLDVGLGEEGAPSNTSDQPDTLGIVHAYDGDLFRLAFVKNGIAYTVQTTEFNATSTINILKSWHFI